MAEDIPRLSFRPDEDEYLYLKSSGISKNWTAQCHQWIARDRMDSGALAVEAKKQSRIDVIESVRNGLLIMGVGILILLIAQGSLLMVPEILAVIYCSAVASVVIGFITIFYRRKKLNG